MRGGFVDDAGQCAKLLGAGGYSRVVQRICHLGFSFGWDFMGETIGEARSFCHRPIPYRILCLSRGGMEETITGIAACCARATTGHAAAPPNAAKNFRRPMWLAM